MFHCNRSTWAAGASPEVAGTVDIPGVTILSRLTDAWFEPLAARQRVAGASFGASATSYDILLDVAVLHLELLGNQSVLDFQRASRKPSFTRYIGSQATTPRPEKAEKPTLTGPCRSGNGTARWCKRPRRTLPLPQPNSRTGSISTPPSGSSRSVVRWSFSPSSRSTLLSKNWFKLPCTDGPTSRPGRRRSTKPRHTGNRKSAVPCSPPFGWDTAVVRSGAAAISRPPWWAISPPAPISTSTFSGPS